MKLIVIIGAFIGVFFVNSGIAQTGINHMGTRGRLFVDDSQVDKIEKVFDSENNMVCYIATYGVFGKAIDCLPGDGDKTVLTDSGSFYVGSDEVKIIKIFDPKENVMCYLVSGMAVIPGIRGDAFISTMDCEKIIPVNSRTRWLQSLPKE